MKNYKKIFFGISLACLAIACSKEDKAVVEDTDTMSFKYELPIPISNMCKHTADSHYQEIRNFIESINKTGKYSFNKLTELHLKTHRAANQIKLVPISTSSNRVVLGADPTILPLDKQKERMSKLSESIKNKPYSEAAPIYESLLQQITGLQVRYNVNSNTISELLKSSELQCYSGTNLSLDLQRRNYTGRDFQKQNFIVLFQPGHMLPGKIIGSDDQKEFYSIETTDHGRVTHHGLVKDFDLKTNKTRVLDAETFTLFDTIKDCILAPTFYGADFTTSATNMFDPDNVSAFFEKFLTESEKSLGFKPYASSSFSPQQNSPHKIHVELKISDEITNETYPEYAKELVDEDLQEFRAFKAKVEQGGKLCTRTTNEYGIVSVNLSEPDIMVIALTFAGKGLKGALSIDGSTEKTVYISNGWLSDFKVRYTSEAGCIDNENQ